MIYNEFKEYLKKKLGYAENTVNNNISYLRRLMRILKNIDEYSQLNEYEKLYKFSNVPDSYKQVFDTYHNYNPANDSTFINYRSSAKKYIEFSQQENNQNEEKTKDTTIKIQPLNQILYGPPGTGKTYNSINKALEIIFEKEDIGQTFEIDAEEKYDITYNQALEDNNREALKAIFDYYKEQGQIEFITFHQSYGYEEFVEGIKADVESDELRYSLEDGVFKKLSDKAKKQNVSKNIFDMLSSGLKIQLLRELHKTITISNQNDKYIYIKNPSGNKHTCNKQNVLDFYRNEDFNPTDQKSYEPAIAKYLYENQQESLNEQNYILIIDEINRGNISKIFGELITLIEPSKRIGEAEEIVLKLPNSSELFGVPSNLYIIGTMNTADRSIAQIDTALRRRFEFVEMMPQHQLLNDIEIDGVKISTMLEAINERIEYIYDREHTIGHSYFMPLLKEATQEKLEEIFRVNIIPLLAEYFYSDWEDICEVLNDDNGYFIQQKELKFKLKTDRGNKVYTINKNEFSIDGYKNIYNGLVKTIDD